MTDNHTECNWRSLLFVPTLADKFLAKAATRGADAIILDLEDSIAPAQKSLARDALPGAVRQLSVDGLDLCVRINRPVEMAIADIGFAVCADVAALMLPKIMGPEHVCLLAEVVAERELALALQPGHTKFIALVETADALPNLPAIAKAHPRMIGLGIGNEDLATELQVVPDEDGLYPFAMQAVAAARAAGISPFGMLGPFANFSDLLAYRTGLQRSRRLGFSSTACIHPAQVAIINEEYGVSPEQLDYAERLVAAFDSALEQGLGAVAFDGTMVDLPVAQRARKLIEGASLHSG